MSYTYRQYPKSSIFNKFRAYLGVSVIVSIRLPTKTRDTLYIVNDYDISDTNYFLNKAISQLRYAY